MAEQSKEQREEEKASERDFSFEMDKMKPEEQARLVSKLSDMFLYALDNEVWIAARKNMIKAAQYREGEQWTAAELKVLRDRHQPPTVNNKISVVVEKLMGDFINQRTRLGFRGRNAPDEEVANALSDIFLYIKQTNDLEFEERDVADDGFTMGVGWLEVFPSFDDLLQPELKVRHEDALVVFPDPDSRRYDPNEDARFIARAKWLALDEAVETYPHVARQLRGVVKGTSALFTDQGTQLSDVDRFKGEIFVDQKKERVRIIEVQYKKTKRENILILANGQVIPFEKPEEIENIKKQAEDQQIKHRIIDRLSHRIAVGVFAAGILLEHKVTDHRYFSLVPYFALRKKNGSPYSLVTLALSLQDAVNKRESKALHLLNTNQVWAETSAVDSIEEVQSEVAKPDGYIKVRDGALRDGRIRPERNIELAVSQFNLHSQAVSDLYETMGVDPKAAGQTGELRSGTGLQKKFLELSKPVARLFDNFRRTRKIYGRVTLDLIQKYFTPGKILLITDDQNTSHPLTITADLLEKIKTSQYDVVVEELEDNVNVQQEQFNTLLQTLPQILPFGPFWMKLLLQMSQIRNKDDVIKELNAQEGPPPIQPRLSIQANLDKLDPDERAGVWAMAGRPDIAQAVSEKQPMTSDELEGTVAIAKETIKAKAQRDKDEKKAAAA